MNFIQSYNKILEAVPLSLRGKIHYYMLTAIFNLVELRSNEQFETKMLDFAANLVSSIEEKEGSGI